MGVGVNGKNGKTNGNGLGCLLMTALVDQGFRDHLLTRPVEAAADFELSTDERRVVTSIRADSLPDFAAQLHRWLEQRNGLFLGDSLSNGNGHHANGSHNGDHKEPAEKITGDA